MLGTTFCLISDFLLSYWNSSHYYARLYIESIEIHKHENNFNKKEESLKLNKMWFLALRNRKIGNQLGIAKGRISTNQSPGRKTANESLGRHSSRQVPGYKYAWKSQPSSLQKRQLEQPPLKMPATDGGKTPGTHNLRPRPTSPEDTMYTDIHCVWWLFLRVFINCWMCQQLPDKSIIALMLTSLMLLSGCYSFIYL